MTATAPKQIRFDFDPPPVIVVTPPDVIYTTTAEGYTYTTDYANTLEAETARRIAAGKPLFAEALAIVERWYPLRETLKLHEQRLLRSWRNFLNRGEDCYPKLGEMRMVWIRRMNEQLKEKVNDTI